MAIQYTDPNNPFQAENSCFWPLSLFQTEIYTLFYSKLEQEVKMMISFKFTHFVIF